MNIFSGVLATLTVFSGSWVDGSSRGLGGSRDHDLYDRDFYRDRDFHRGAERDWMRDNMREELFLNNLVRGHDRSRDFMDQLDRPSHIKDQLDRPSHMDFLFRPEHLATTKSPHKSSHQSFDQKSFWDYSVENGPDHWAERYPECAGLKQSPVALPTLKENHTFIRRLGFYNYEHEHQLFLQNNGHQIDLVIGKPTNSEKAKCGGSVFPPKNYFELDRVEFHWGSESTRGSEHTMHGRAFPGEMQFIHFDKRFKSIKEASRVPGAIVIAVILMKVVDEDNKNLDPILNNLHRVNGTTKPVSIGVHNLEWLYPTDVSEVHECEFYMYEGSYTSPPCSEVVMWHVYRDQTGISERQLNHLRSVVSQRGRSLTDNYRPMQSQNDRKIWQFRETIQMNKNTDSSKGSAFSNFVKFGQEDDRKSRNVGNVHHPRDRHLMDRQRHNDLMEEVYDGPHGGHGAARPHGGHGAAGPHGGHGAADGVVDIHDRAGFSYVRPYDGPMPADYDPSAGGYGA